MEKMGEITMLLELQQIESALEKLQKELKELPVFEEFKNLQAQSADAKETLGWSEGKLKEHQKRMRRLESQLRLTEDECKELQSRLYGNAAQSAKELEQLERKAEALNRDRLAQEEAILLAMENTEALEKAYSDAKAERHTLQSHVREKQKTGNEEINRLKEEILELRRRRDLITQQVTPALLDEYRELRKRFHGRPVALVENDICRGCRVSVSSVVKAKLYDSACKTYCDNCGRLLVPYA